MYRSLAIPLILVALAACATAAPAPAPAPAPGTVRHVVVFRYRPTATPEQIREVTNAFRALRSSIPGIVGFEHGVNDSPEGKNLGFTHVYLLTFENASARDADLPHPEHMRFGQLLGRLGVLDDAFVVDYSPVE